MGNTNSHLTENSTNTAKDCKSHAELEGGKDKLEQFQQWIVKVSDLQQKEKQLNLKEEELMRKENNLKSKWTEDPEVEKQMQRETKKLQDRVLALENIVYQHKHEDTKRRRYF